MSRYREIRAVNRHLVLSTRKVFPQSWLLRRWNYRADSVVQLPKKSVKRLLLASSDIVDTIKGTNVIKGISSQPWLGLVFFWLKSANLIRRQRIAANGQIAALFLQ